MEASDAPINAAERHESGAPRNRAAPHVRGRREAPVKEEFWHTAGGLHGSGYFKLLDDEAFFAAQSMNPTHFVVTTSFTSLHHKGGAPAKVPTLTSTGTGLFH